MQWQFAQGLRNMTATIEKPTQVPGVESPRPKPATPAAQTNIRVWLTDDNAVFRNTLATVLECVGPFVCEQQYHSAEALLDALAREPAPEVILLDVEMGGMKGVDALPLIRPLAPKVRVLVVTSFYDPIYETQAVLGGASAFLLKTYTAERIVEEIQAALAAPLQTMETFPHTFTRRASTIALSDVGQQPTGFVTRLTRWAGQVFTAFLPHACPPSAPAK
jgi:DNA-binding NarL/FixJ family response regulator